MTIDVVERAPRSVLAAVLALHVALWGLIPALFQPNLPLDAIEQLAWGHEWQWAYFKHPPLPAWVLETVAQAVGGWDRALFFVGPLATGLALFLVWRLACETVGPRAALLAVLLQEGVLYFTFFTPEFNHNVAQLPVWALIGWTGYRAIRRARTTDWIALGVAVALGMLAKYSTGLLVASLAVFILAEPSARARLKTAGPWLAVAVAMVLLVPHALAVRALHYGPLNFPLARAHEAAAWYLHLFFPLRFAGAQLLNILGAIAMVLLLWRGRAKGATALPTAAFDRRYVATLCWAPFGLSLAISGVLGLGFHSMWGAPMWDFIGLFAIMFAIRSAPLPSRGAVALWLAIFAGGPLVFAAQFPVQALTGAKPLRGQFPGLALADAVDAGWHRVAGQAPLRYVAGDIWLTGNVAFALWRERPAVLIDGDFAISPWVDRRDLACAGAVLLWPDEQPGTRRSLLAGFPGASVQPTLELPWQTRARRPVAVGWAIVPPRPNCG